MTTPLARETPQAADASVESEPYNAVATVWTDTWRASDLRFWLANHLPRLLPAPLAGRVRPRLFRLAGVSVGPGCFLWGAFQMNATKNARRNLQIGNHCFFNAPVWLDLNAPITFEENVSVGHHVTIITSSHQIGAPNYRAGKVTPLPVTIKAGAWLGARVTLLPGITIGAGAIVAAGALVACDVPENVLVGGVPAKVIRAL